MRDCGDTSCPLRRAVAHKVRSHRGKTSRLLPKRKRAACAARLSSIVLVNQAHLSGEPSTEATFWPLVATFCAERVEVAGHVAAFFFLEQVAVLATASPLLRR